MRAGCVRQTQDSCSYWQDKSYETSTKGSNDPPRGASLVRGISTVTIIVRETQEYRWHELEAALVEADRLDRRSPPFDLARSRGRLGARPEDREATVGHAQPLTLARGTRNPRANATEERKRSKEKEQDSPQQACAFFWHPAHPPFHWSCPIQHPDEPPPL